jgi:nitrite reductase/ring-hydroxylating ferredoxin subunit
MERQNIKTARYTLCHADAIPINASRKFDIPTLGEVVVFRTAFDFFALENRCPHAGAPLDDAMVIGNRITCIWHGWEFDLCTGRCTSVPGKSARTFTLEVENEVLYLITNKNDSKEQS